MGTPHSQAKHDRLRAKIVEVWRDRGHTEATIAHYLKCVERYRLYCLRLGVEEIGRLTRRSVDRFATAYARRRGRDVEQCIEEARSSLRAWARAAAVTGLRVPDWVPPGKPGPFDAELARYYEFGRRWRGVKDTTLDRESEVITRLLKWLRQHRQPLSSITLKTIDAFLVEMATTSAPITLAGVCSRLRSFLRFLHATDVLSFDPAARAVAPCCSMARCPSTASGD
jgi:site-specific recombinase XerD